MFLSHACLRLYKGQNGHPCIPWNPINFVARIAQKICINICFATKMTKNLRRNRDSQGKGAGVGVSCRGDEHPKNQRRLKKKKQPKGTNLRTYDTPYSFTCFQWKRWPRTVSMINNNFNLNHFRIPPFSKHILSSIHWSTVIMRSICVADDLICSARADRYLTCIDCGAAWSVVSPTAIFVITAVKMLCTYEARENKKSDFSSIPGTDPSIQT